MNQNKKAADRPQINHLGLFSKVVLGIATILTLAATSIMVLEGFSRFFLGVSYFWAEESVRFLLVWAFFLTLGIAGFRQFHIRTELFVQRFSPALQRFSWMLSCVFGMIFAGILGYSSIDQVHRYYTMGMLSESNLEVPMWIVFLAMPIGGIAMFIYYAYAFWYSVRWGDPFVSEDGAEPLLDEATMNAMASKGAQS
jgi:TRAP-type C4-dicarboxylate transport system permease small subunit